MSVVVGRRIALSAACCLAWFWIAAPSSFSAAPQTLEEDARAARSYFDAGDWNAAIVGYKRALSRAESGETSPPPTLRLRLAKGLSAAYNNRGLEHERRGDWDAALNDFHRALELDDSFALARRNLIAAHRRRGERLRSLGEYEESIAAYDRAIELNPRNPYSYVGRAQAHLSNERCQDALDDYDRALSFSPNNLELEDRRDSAYVFCETRY